MSSRAVARARASGARRPRAPRPHSASFSGFSDRSPSSSRSCLAPSLRNPPTDTAPTGSKYCLRLAARASTSRNMGCPHPWQPAAGFEFEFAVASGPRRMPSCRTRHQYRAQHRRLETLDHYRVPPAPKLICQRTIKPSTYVSRSNAIMFMLPCTNIGF